MEPTVFLLVATAAILHAVWNAMVKVGGDQLVAVSMIMASGGVAALCLTPFVSFPEPTSWLYLAASTAIHLCYYGCLVMSYRHGDLSLVYPIARGSAPAIVAIGAYLAAGEVLPPLGILAVAIISLAILSLAATGRGVAHGARSVFFAVCTGISIAAYTLVDGLGGRATQHVQDYIVWLFVIEPLPLVAITVALRRGRLMGTVRKEWRAGALGGLFSAIAYGLVIWAMSITPMTYVSALRETSVIVAALIGAHMLHEPMGRRRIWAACIVVVGIVLLQQGHAG